MTDKQLIDKLRTHADLGFHDWDTVEQIVLRSLAVEKEANRQLAGVQKMFATLDVFEPPAKERECWKAMMKSLVDVIKTAN